MNTSPALTFATFSAVPALPAAAFPIANATRVLFGVPCDGGFTAYTPCEGGFRAFGELVYASAAQLTRVMGSY